MDYTATPKSDQEILTALLNVRDDFVLNGKFMQKNYTMENGVTIFIRTPDDLEAYINLYQSKVDAASGNSTYMVRGYLYA